MKSALIIVDLQNDFLPGGALAVPHGDEVIPIANELQKRFELVVATQDWHPPDHASFAANHSGKKPGERMILDGCRGIELEHGDVSRALEEMKQAGAILLKSGEI